MKRRSRDWLTLSLLGIGGLLVTASLWFSWGELRFAADSEQVAGTVIEVPRGSVENRPESFGRVAFDHRGQRHILAMWPGSGSGTLPEDAIVGDVETMLVPPGEPDHARIAEFGNRYGLKIVIFFFGAIMLLGAFVFRQAEAPLSDDGRSIRRVALGFLAVGVCLAAIAAVAAVRHEFWVNRSIETIGVAEYRENRVRVRITDRQGRIWHARAPFLPDQLPPGRDYVTVPVRYDSTQPWEIAPFGWRELWSTQLFLGGFALMFCAVPLLGLWLMWRRDRRRAPRRATEP